MAALRVFLRLLFSAIAYGAFARFAPPMLIGAYFIAGPFIAGLIHVAFVWSEGAAKREFALVSWVSLTLMMAMLTLWIPGAWSTYASP